MKISEMIEQLEKLKKEHGDLDVKVQSLSHLWDAEPVTKILYGGNTKYILLNP